MEYTSMWCRIALIFLFGCTVPPNQEQGAVTTRVDSVDAGPEAGKAVQKESRNKSLGIDEKAFAHIQLNGLEERLERAGLVSLEKAVPGIQIDLKYSTTDNFVGYDLYGEFNTAYAQPVLAEMLEEAQKLLWARDSSYHLVVYDAYRPLQVQQALWDAMRHMPFHERVQYVSNPKNGSVHNYGAALDVSIVDGSGEALDMGTPFDFFGPEAQPKLENELLRSGALDSVQWKNRILLRRVMKTAGFRQLPTEWWHYNMCSRKEAQRRFTMIR